MPTKNRQLIFFIFSHNLLRKENKLDLWWKALRETGLDEKIKKFENYLFFGEVYGNVQDLKYGLGNNIDVRIFDIMCTKSLKYLDYFDMKQICEDADIKTVPLLYSGEVS